MRTRRGRAWTGKGRDPSGRRPGRTGPLQAGARGPRDGPSRPRPWRAVAVAGTAGSVGRVEGIGAGGSRIAHGSPTDASRRAPDAPSSNGQESAVFLIRPYDGFRTPRARRPGPGAPPTHGPVTEPLTSSRSLGLPCESLTSRASRGGHSLPHCHRHPRGRWRPTGPVGSRVRRRADPRPACRSEGPGDRGPPSRPGRSERFLVAAGERWSGCPRSRRAGAVAANGPWADRARSTPPRWPVPPCARASGRCPSPTSTPRPSGRSCRPTIARTW